MKKIKIYSGVKDRFFFEKLQGLSRYVEFVKEVTSIEKLNGNSKEGELLFLDRIPPAGFSNLKVRGVFVASRYSKRKEFLAARSGARGFLTKDASRTMLLKAIKDISSGEIWMTRETIARVFEEFARIVQSP